MITVPQAPPKVARIRRNKVTGQLDLFAPVAEFVIPVTSPSSTRSRMLRQEKYIFCADSGKPTHVKCCRCSTLKPVCDFDTRPEVKIGLAPFCRECRRVYSRNYYRNDNGKIARNIHLRNTYGITIEDYESMLESQGGVCAVCGGPETGKYRSHTKKSFAVDHCHKTGKVRGLLCSSCNTGIGALRDSREVLESAIVYLTIHGD